MDISYFSDPHEVENEISGMDLNIIHNIGTDSISYFIVDQLDNMSEEQWKSFVNLHLRHCEDVHSFGMSMHGLLVANN